MNKAFAGLFIFTFVSCNAPLVKEEKKVFVPAVQDSLTPWEVEMKQMEKELSDKKAAFQQIKKEKAFDFKCYDQCGEGEGVNMEELKKYGKRKPLDIRKNIQGDSIAIQFRFIADCCLEYIGDVEKRGDTLKLTYENIGFSPCDCYCYYYYRYTLPKNKYAAKYIMLADSLISF